jgi:hypothetical protein
MARTLYACRANRSIPLDELLTAHAAGDPRVEKPLAYSVHAPGPSQFL